MSEPIYRSKISRLAGELSRAINNYVNLVPEDNRKSDFYEACTATERQLGTLSEAALDRALLDVKFIGLGLSRKAELALNRAGYMNLHDIVVDPEMTEYRLRNHVNGISYRTAVKIIQAAESAGSPLRKK